MPPNPKPKEEAPDTGRKAKGEGPEWREALLSYIPAHQRAGVLAAFGRLEPGRSSGIIEAVMVVLDFYARVTLGIVHELVSAMSRAEKVAIELAQAMQHAPALVRQMQRNDVVAPRTVYARLRDVAAGALVFTPVAILLTFLLVPEHSRPLVLHRYEGKLPLSTSLRRVHGHLCFDILPGEWMIGRPDNAPGGLRLVLPENEGEKETARTQMGLLLDCAPAWLRSDWDNLRRKTKPSQ